MVHNINIWYAGYLIRDTQMGHDPKVESHYFRTKASRCEREVRSAHRLVPFFCLLVSTSWDVNWEEGAERGMK